MKECLKRELDCTKYMDKYSKKTPEDNRRRFERLLKKFSEAYDQVIVESCPKSNHGWEWEICFYKPNYTGCDRAKTYTAHYDCMNDVAFVARYIFEDVIDKLKLEEEMEEKNEEPKKVYITTGWDRHNPLFNTYVDTDVASMYPKFTFKSSCHNDACDSLRYTKEFLNGKFGLSSQNHTPEIKDVIFNDPATIVFWADGTKTVVRCQDGEAYDPEKGLAMAISKKALGNTREYYHTFLHWLKKVKKNSESVKMLEIGKSMRNGIAKGIADYLEYQGVLPQEKEKV